MGLSQTGPKRVMQAQRIAAARGRELLVEGVCRIRTGAGASDFDPITVAHYRRVFILDDNCCSVVGERDGVGNVRRIEPQISKAIPRSQVTRTDSGYQVGFEGDEQSEQVPANPATKETPRTTGIALLEVGGPAEMSARGWVDVAEQPPEDQLRTGENGKLLRCWFRDETDFAEWIRTVVMADVVGRLPSSIRIGEGKDENPKVRAGLVGIETRTKPRREMKEGRIGAGDPSSET